MTSATSRDDVEQQAWLAGIRDPLKMTRLMRTVDLYAYSLARTLTPLEEASSEPDEKKDDGRVRYLCRKCDERLPLRAFPPEKQDDPGHPYDCITCGSTDRREYWCPDCETKRPVSDFPERKRQDPRRRVSCTYHDARRITPEDAGSAKKH
jgi:hypothetical protein